MNPALDPPDRHIMVTTRRIKEHFVSDCMFCLKLNHATLPQRNSEELPPFSTWERMRALYGLQHIRIMGGKIDISGGKQLGER
jgi:hypothetical protein